jgi:DNA-binding transcriptional MerR regulator/methylmalonyl-CoA mutase cobalamin-binding subunit
MSNESTASGAENTVHDSFPLRTVTGLTGLSADLIRAWERRYGVVSPVRGPRGARLYSNEDIAHLKLLADLVGEGRTIGDIAKLDRAELEQLQAKADSVEAAVLASDHVPSPYEAWSERFFEALGNFDADRVALILSDGALSLGSRSFLTELAIPLLREVGNRWVDGRISIAQEHLVSRVLRDFLGSFGRFRQITGKPAVVIATPSGERHEFGAAILGMKLIESSVAAISVGSDLPAQEILDVVSAVNPQVLALSVVTETNRERTVEEVRVIEKGLNRSVQLWLGGADAGHVMTALGNTRALNLSATIPLEREITALIRRQS